MIRILHLADLHLGYKPSLPSPWDQRVARERDGLLGRAVDLALKQKVHMVVIAGDLFDHHRPLPGLVENVVKELRRLEKEGIRVITVPGNHDEITYHDSVYRQGSWPGLLVTNPHPQLVAEWEIEGQPCRIVSMAYVGGVTRTDGLLDSFPPAESGGINLAVFHGSLDWEGGDRSLPLSGEALARAGYHYVALGHIHRGGERRWPGGMALYAGMVAGKNFSDPGVGYWTLVRLGEGGPWIERIPEKVSSWQAEDIDLSAFSRPEEVEEVIGHKASSSGGLLQVRLTGSPPFFLSQEQIQRWEARWSREDAYLEIKDETRGWRWDLLEEWGKEANIKGIFLRRLQERLEQARDAEEREIIEMALRKGVAALKEVEGRCRPSGGGL